MIKLPKFIYTPTSGHFATMPRKKGVDIVDGTGILEWHGCREQFHRAICRRDEKSFLFVATTASQDYIRKFIIEFESRAGIAPKYQIQFKKTDNPVVMYVVVSKWWSKQPIRHSLLTALLRCAVRYDGTNFVSALYSRTYTTETKTAVERFLSGHTWFVGNGAQWHATFRNYRTPDFVERVLIKEGSVAAVSAAAVKEAKNIISIAKSDRVVLELLIAQSLDQFRREAA